MLYIQVLPGLGTRHRWCARPKHADPNIVSFDEQYICQLHRRCALWSARGHTLILMNILQIGCPAELCSTPRPSTKSWHGGPTEAHITCWILIRVLSYQYFLGAGFVGWVGVGQRCHFASTFASSHTCWEGIRDDRYNACVTVHCYYFVNIENSTSCNLVSGEE